MIRNIVFDMGMVLMQWDPMNPCMRYARDPEKARILCDNIFRHPEWAPNIDGGVMTEPEYFVHCSKRMPTEELRELCLAMSKDWTLDSLYPTTGMKAMIEELHRQGYRLYVLSNCGGHFDEFAYRIPGVEYFSGFLVSAKEHLMKPQPEIYARLFEKFDLKPEECIFIDDLQTNIDASIKAGMQGYCFADGDVKRLWAHLNSMND